MTMPRILILPRYDRLGASSRLRMFQFVAHLDQHGLTTDVAPLFPADYVRDLQSGRRNLRTIAGGYWRRIRRLGSGRPSDLLWIEKELFPWLPWGIERWFLPRGVPVILDYDDAVFLQYETHRNPLVRRLLGDKHCRAMRHASAVIAGNATLADYARSAGARMVVEIPTMVDAARYEALERPPSTPPIVCWIGQQSTAAFLKPLIPLIDELQAAGTLRFRAIGIVAEAGLPVETQPWSEETEVAAIRACDIGIMPLPNTPFERGKCAYKLIQYMACGLPVIASPVGANCDVVEDGQTGLLATTEAEWRRAFLLLAGDLQLRLDMGRRGRARVEQAYDLPVALGQLVNLFDGIIRDR